MVYDETLNYAALTVTSPAPNMIGIMGKISDWIFTWCRLPNTQLFRAFQMVGLLVICVVFLYILSTPSANSDTDSQKKWRIVAALNADQLAAACDSYKQDNGHYPSTTDNAALYAILHANQTSSENQRGIRYADIGPKYISPNGEVLDPWKTPFRIVFDNHSVTVTSAGADKLFDTADDIIKRR